MSFWLYNHAFSLFLLSNFHCFKAEHCMVVLLSILQVNIILKVTFLSLLHKQWTRLEILASRSTGLNVKRLYYILIMNVSEWCFKWDKPKDHPILFRKAHNTIVFQQTHFRLLLLWINIPFASVHSWNNSALSFSFFFSPSPHIRHCCT